MDELLRHPLLTLSVGAVLTGIVVPRVTREWQLRQKRLEVKVALVADVSELVMRFMMAIQFAHLGSASLKPPTFDNAYRDWEVGSAVLGTKLEVYLPGSELPAEWSRFSEAVTDFYALEGMCFEKRRATSQLLGSLLAAYAPSGQKDEWQRHRSAILSWKAALLRRLMRSAIRLSP